MPAPACEAGDHFLATGLCPQTLEQQRRADATHGDRETRVLARGLQHHRLLRQAGAGTQHAIERSAGFEFVEPAQGSDHALAHLIADALALDDLQVDASLRLLAAEIHMRIGHRSIGGAYIMAEMIA